MRKLVLTLATLAATASFATAKEMSEMDVNEDGVLSVEEFAAGHSEVDPAVFAAIDANEDGLIDPSEYEAATGEGGVLAEG
ncbi:hypothetical protein [Amylibacter sp. IMCC11727]|uniref:hypothetical protein n=1 Tax=Amylibacter sp. IMCC11727 TaxID=3039851 RepID=UPI00244DF497|nr:hypothetical protein [Amylibacter sp. IMCC11727]WGI22359.1 hypothetical protein QBD29_02760 [Amylibacter sp. IMCC11727]